MKLLATMILLFSQSLFAGLALETNTFAEVEKKANELGKKYGSDNVLIVLDIDNTLLKMKGQMGSDQWFNWQSKSCSGKKQPDYCVGKNFGELLQTQGVLFEILPMMATEEMAPKVVNGLQKKGHPLFLLTSRGYDFRSATERELKKAGYKLKNYIGPKNGYAGTYIPYDVKEPKKYNLTKEDITLAKLKKARKTSYMNGVMMTAGLNKGIMLKTILHKTKTSPRAIIFVDDHKKHTDRVQAILGKKKDIELVTFRYGAVDKTVKEFNDSDKAEVKKQYTLLKKAINSMVQ